MHWERTDPANSYSKIDGVDPFADWYLGPGFEDFSRGDDQVLIPCTVGPLDEETVSRLQALSSEGKGLVSSTGTSVPATRSEMKPGQHVVAFVKKEALHGLARNKDSLHGFAQTVRQIDLGPPLASKSLPSDSHAPATEPVAPPVFRPGDWPEGTVVIGIIDDGIAFGHDAFRLGDGTTRVQYFWQQDGIYQEPESTVAYGREICKLSHASRKGIDALLKDHAQAGLVDEEAVYREAGSLDFRDPDHKPLAWMRAHGTHVLYHAAGYDADLNRVDRPIIAVQLPVSVTADTSGSNLKPYALDAIHYILDRADRLAGKGQSPDGTWTPLPVVINFSYGMIAGPHDGTLELEQAIDALTAARSAPLRVVLPAGNANLARCHANLRFERTGISQTLHWRVQPDDLTPTFMEIWLPHDGPEAPKKSRVKVRISTPLEEPGLELSEQVGDGIQLVSKDRVIGTAGYSYRPYPTERGVFAIAIAPTARLADAPGSQDSTAPSGVWSVTITNIGLEADQDINVWIQWDDVIYGYARRGRQSYFEAEPYVRFDPISGDIVDTDPHGSPCCIKREGTINAIASGGNTIVIGGVRQSDLKPPTYTATGPTTPTRNSALCRSGPDAACVTDDSRIHGGILGAGARSGAAVAMGGTSVAAPQIARLVADMLASGSPGNREAIQRVAQDSEDTHKRTAVDLPPLGADRSGYGRIVLPRPGFPRTICGR